MNNEERPELDSEIREIFAEGGLECGPHPPSEVLSAYARDELGGSEAERLQEHLGLCRRCTATVLAGEFQRLPAAEPLLADAEVAAGVEAVVARIRSRPPRPVPAGGWSIQRWGMRVAAVFALACFAMAFLVAKLQRDVSQLERALSTVRTAAVPVSPSEAIGPPQTGVPIVDLYPGSVVRGEEAAATAIEIPTDVALVTLILNPPSGLSHDAYALRISNATGSELWRGAARPNEAGAFVLVLPRGFVAEDPERIGLYGVDDGKEQLVKEYRVRFGGV